MAKEPKHIAIVLDGNRRWAKKHNLPLLKGHEEGFQRIKDTLKWCIDLGITQTTLYCFSTENFSRNKKEKDYLFNLFRRKFDSFSKEDIIHKNKVKIRVIGNISMFPKDMQKKMMDVMEKTKDYNNYKLNLAMAYGGRTELIDAIKGIIKDKISSNNISEGLIKKHLYLKDEPDIFIRPGGEKRISNFLLWQSAYSELFFLEKYWPDFSKEDLINIIEEFKQTFDTCDVIIAPTSPSVAFPIGSKITNPLDMYMNDIFTQPANIAGIPAISIPGGFHNNLPFGIQFIGNYLSEKTLFKLANAYEKASSFTLTNNIINETMENQLNKL